MAIPKLNSNQLKAICDILADTSEGLTGSVIGSLLHQCGIPDPNPGITKRDRLFSALHAKQERDACATNVVAFIQTAMDPVRFVNNHNWFNDLRDQLNQALAFSGYQLGEDGKLKAVTQAQTLSEADERAGRLRAELTRRRVHHD